MKRFYIETFGCQMNFSDSEIVASILLAAGYQTCSDVKEADVIFLNTCSIREHAEDRVFKRLSEFNALKKNNKKIKIGILGCMAERLKDKIFENAPIVDIIVGPDSYRDLPTLLLKSLEGEKTFNILLSQEETYADINPVRINSNGISAYVSIMRGCQNFCSYCVVPYTRGKERSRNPASILSEIEDLYEKGFKEVTLLGQNVNSYSWKEGYNMNFAQLIYECSRIAKDLRLRFATSHPKDLSDELIQVIANNDNICKSIHLPVQSGSNRILEKMNRKYTREWYLSRIKMIKDFIPNCSISTDIITGFPDESEEDFQATCQLMMEVGFDFAYMFKYSERSGTYAADNFKDNVPEEIKIARLQKIIELQQQLSLRSNQNDVGKVFEVLVEDYSKRSKNFLSGRNSQNKVVVFEKKNYQPKTYVNIIIKSCTTATLIGEPVE